MQPSFTPLRTEAELRQVYGEVSPFIRDKALPALDAHARAFIGLSPFVSVGTGRGGAFDVSPRGGAPGFVQVLDDSTLAFADRPGNNRLDTLENLIHTPAVGLLFFVPGFEEMLRVNGEAFVTVDEALMARFVHEGKRPRSVVVVQIAEVFLHCTKALKRSALWDAASQVPRSALPSFGQMLREQYTIDVPADEIEAGLRQDAERNLY